MKVSYVCLIVAMAIAGAAAAGDFNFFPTNGLKATAPGEVIPEPFPAPWLLSAQAAYPELGNAKGQALLKIAVGDFQPDGPTLYVTPGAWCDTAGAGVGPSPASLLVKGSVKPESAPATPEAAPATREAAPATPEAAPATPEAAPATPEAAPATPEAAPATPEEAAPEETILEEATPEEAAAAAAADAAAAAEAATPEAAKPEEPAPAAGAATPATDAATPATTTAPATAPAAAAAITKPATAPVAAATTTKPATAPVAAATTTKPATAPVAAATTTKPATAPMAAATTTKPATAPAATAQPVPRRLMQAGAAAPATDAAAPAVDAAAPEAEVVAPAEEAAAEEPTLQEVDAASEDAAAAAAADSAPAKPVTPVEGAAFTVETPCALAADTPVTFSLGQDGATQIAEKITVGGEVVYKVALPPNMADGPVCVTISANYDTSKVTTIPAYTAAFEPMGPTTAFVRTVCLYKQTKQANARLEFDMCTNNQFTVNISDVTPLPVNLTLDDAPLDSNLFRPMVKVFGGKVAELDGTPTNGNYDEVASRTQYNWLARYFPINSNYKGEPLSFALSDTLQEGYYEVSSVVSLVTNYPLLTALAGLTQITQEDASGTAVKGLWEAAARQIHAKALVGVQKGSTPTTLSAISSSSHVPGQAVLPGQKVILNWQFRGVGSSSCTHDGLVVANSADGSCVSPLTIDARDVATTDTKHYVVVTFNDVCGGNRTAEFEYTQAGVRPLTAPEVLNADGTIQKIVDGASAQSGPKSANPTMKASGPDGSAKTNSAEGAVAATALAGAAALAAAALLL